MKWRPPKLFPRAALFLDLDGTLLEIAPRPELVRVPEDLPALLARLAAQRGGALAMVSGRPLGQIDGLLLPWQGPAAGLHGAERRRADGKLVTAETPADHAAAEALGRLRPSLIELEQHLPGVRLEDKGRTLAVHYRAAPERATEVHITVTCLLQGEGGHLRLIPGKMVLELQPRSRGKDRAIAAFMRESPFCNRQPVFLGDDTTDEDGFDEVNRQGGLSVRIGEAGAVTAAQYGLPSVAAALAWLRAGAAD